MREKLKEQKGITLIALVITIIVLLILAGVSISMLTGQNGILNQAQEAKSQTEYKSAEEKVKLAVMGARANDGQITVSELKTEVGYQGGSVTGDAFPLAVQISEHNFVISSNGVVTYKAEAGNVEVISKTQSYVGYYADIEGDGKVDGIIYADLATGNTKDGQWIDNEGAYNISVVGGVKDYYISQKNYNGSFGIKDVVVPAENGKERFYVMALTDIDAKQETRYTWYSAVNDNMNDYATTTSLEFGKGRDNTNTMITKWDTKAYGEQNANGKYRDIWGEIKKQASQGWFVPSKAEWAAFAEELGITKENHTKFGMHNWYWSSSQKSTIASWYANFDIVGVKGSRVKDYYFVRLSTIF